MCITPIKVKNAKTGLTELVNCRHCWQCQNNRLRDFAGRAIAEAKFSKKSYFITLTYGGGDDNINAKILVYRDFQLFMKLLRKKYGTVRYFVAGERGELKGRAHWHVILFFKDGIPDWPLNKAFHPTDVWPHGHVWADEVTYKSVRYCMVYANKHNKYESVVQYSMSKYPPLGYEYFEDLASRYVENAIVPSSPEYTFEDVFVKRKGQTFLFREKFLMLGKTRENFVKLFTSLWERKYGRRPKLSSSDWFDDYTDKISAAERKETLNEFYIGLAEKHGHKWAMTSIVPVKWALAPQNHRMICKDQIGRYFLFHVDMVDVYPLALLNGFSDILAIMRGKPIKGYDYVNSQ